MPGTTSTTTAVSGKPICPIDDGSWRADKSIPRDVAADETAAVRFPEKANTWNCVSVLQPKAGRELTRKKKRFPSERADSIFALDKIYNFLRLFERARAQKCKRRPEQRFFLIFFCPRGRNISCLNVHTNKSPQTCTRISIYHSIYLSTERNRVLFVSSYFGNIIPPVIYKPNYVRFREFRFITLIHM